MKYLFYTNEKSINKAFHYLLGFQPDFGTMIFDEDILHIFLDARYFDRKNDISQDNIKKRLKKDTFKVNFILFDQNYKKNLQEIIGNDVLILEKSINYSFYENMKKIGFEIDFIDDYFKDLRTIKQDDEIINMKKAIEIMDKVLFDIKDFVESEEIIGKTEKEVRAYIISKIFEYLGEGESFDTIVAFGKGSSIPHYETSDTRITNGVLLIDTGAKYKGYCSDFTRTYRVGEQTDDYELFDNIYNIVKIAYEKAVNGIKAGIKCSELDALARDYITQQGYGPNFNHSLGHGIGLDAHENFGINPKTEIIIPENAFITIEPGIYLSGKFGVRLEDTFQVTKAGYQKFAKNKI